MEPAQLHDTIVKLREERKTRKVYHRVQGRPHDLVLEPSPDLLQQFRVQGGLLFRTMADGSERLCVPNDCTDAGASELTLRQRYINHVHNNTLHTHIGVQRTIYELKRRADWPTLVNDATEQVARCDQCRRNKTNRRAYQGPLQLLSKPLRPGTHYAVDFITPLPKSGHKGHDQLLVIVDRFSKYTWLVPTHTTAGAKITAEQFIAKVIYTRVQDRDGDHIRPRCEISPRKRVLATILQLHRHVIDSIVVAAPKHQRHRGTANCVRGRTHAHGHQLRAR